MQRKDFHMKKITSVLLCMATLVLLSAGAAVGSFAEDAATPAREAVYANSKPKLDGEIDSVWSTAPELKIEGGGNTYGYAKVLWDETGVYLLGESFTKKDADHDYMVFGFSEKDFSAPWGNGPLAGNVNISVWVDGRVWADWYAVTPDRPEFRSDIQYTGKYTEKGYVIEVFIPATANGADIYRENSKVRFAAYFQNNGDMGNGLGWEYWVRPDGYAELIFVANPCTHTQYLDANCTYPRRCAGCGKTDGTELNPDVHTLVWEIKEGTHSSHCADCNKVLAAEASHTWEDEFTVDVEPTCTEAGIKSKHCSVCDAKGEETVMEALGHDFSDGFTYDVAPTCTKKGTHSHHCSRCDATTGSEEVAALGHEYGEWSTVRKATCSKTGIEHKTCVRCWLEGETRETPTLPHTGGDWIVDKEAAVGVAGKRHKVCSVCRQNFDEEEIPALTEETTEEKGKEPSGGCKGAIEGDLLLVTFLLLIAGAYACKTKLSAGRRE